MKNLRSPTEFFYQEADHIDSVPNPQIEDLTSRLLDLEKCPLCRNQYQLLDEDRLPRIMVHCGHTFCTKCLQQFFMNKRVRCPMCLKLIKKIHLMKALPINHTIFQHLAKKDEKQAQKAERRPLVADSHKIIYSEFIRSTTENRNQKQRPKIDKTSHLNYCSLHSERIEHFFCLFHEVRHSEAQNPGCRQCMETSHKLPQCKILDLYQLKKSNPKKQEDQMLEDIQNDIDEMEI